MADLGGGDCAWRPPLLEEDVGVWGLELEGVNDLKTPVRSTRECGRGKTDKESNLRMSAWEYDAPKTALGSVAFPEPFLAFAGRLRQNGEEFLLLFAQSFDHVRGGVDVLRAIYMIANG